MTEVPLDVTGIEATGQVAKGTGQQQWSYGKRKFKLRCSIKELRLISKQN